jgi:predicted nucleotidyltransferase
MPLLKPREVSYSDVMLADIHDRLIEFAEDRQEILAVFVFGSYASGRGRVGSDVDIALYVEPAVCSSEQRMELWLRYTHELESLLQSRVDVVLLNIAPPILRHQVFRKGKLVFERNPQSVRRFVGNALVEFYDEIVMLEPVQNRLIRRHLLGR